MAQRTRFVVGNTRQRGGLLVSSRKANDAKRTRAQRRRAQWFESLEPRYALAAIQDWFERGVGGGGALFSPSINPLNPNEMYIASDMGQVFHTTNEGTTWQSVDFRELQGSTNSKMQYTVNPQILYSLDYSTGGDFIRPTKSTDGGATWTPIAADPTNAEAFTIVADYNNPDRILVSDYSTIWISNDGGASFQQRYTTSNGNGAHIAGAFFDGNNIYLGTNQGVLVSTNGGASFSLTSWGGNPAGQQILSLAGAKEGGTTRLWIVTMSAGDVYASIPGNDHYGYAGIHRIDVGQAGWQQITTGITAGSHPFFVSSTLNDIDTVYVGGGSEASRPTVFKSTSGGGNWTSVLNTINNGNVQTGWSGDGGNRGWSYGENAMGFTVDLFDPNRIVITDFGFAHLSEDGGASWRALYVNPADLNPANAAIPANESYRSSGLDNTTVWGLTWTSPTHIVTANSDIRGVQSYDGGVSWGFNYTGHTANSLYKSIVHPTTGVVYAATASVHDMYQSTHLTDAAINGGTGSVLFSTNGGTTWQTMHNFGRVVTWVEADPTNPNRLYAAVAHSTDGGVWVTNNASAGAASTWTKLANPPRTEGHAFNIKVLNDGTIVATYSGRRTGSGFTASSGVFVSTNGGASWQDRSHSGMLYWTKDVVVDQHDASQNTWYASVFSGWGGAPNGLGGLYKTTNRGATWTRINALDRVNSVTISPTNPNEAYLTTEVEGLWYTENLNAANPTFAQVAGYKFMQPTRVVYNPYDANEVWVASFGGGMRVGYATPTPGNVSLAQATYTVSETGGSLLVSVSRGGGTAGAVSISYATANGSATAGQDYTATNGTLSWADGETGAKTFSIPLTNDSLFESNETFTVALSNPTNGLTLGSTTTSTVTVTSDDAQPLPGLVALAQATYTVSETGGSLVVSVSRSGGSAGAVSISYATANGSATAGQDYAATSGVLSWADGETGAKTFSIPLTDDALVENNETFTISLSSPTGGLAIGSPGTATVTLTSDDVLPAPPGVLQFSQGVLSLSEAGGSVVINVTRTGGSAGAASVAYATANGTATAGQDYTAASGTLNWADGDSSTKSFSIAVTNDTLDEVLETISLSLNGATGASLGSQATALLQILDDDDPPPTGNNNIEFDSALYDTREDYVWRSIYVQRNGDISQPGSVAYTTVDGSATAGTDYLAQSGVVQFAAGERVKKLDIRILNDNAIEPTETLTVELSSPSGGVLGQRATTTIRIADDEVNSAGVIQFDRATYETQENWGYANIYLQRTGGTVGAVSVQFAVTPGTAQPGSDYQPITGTVNFAAGQKSATVRVYLVNDNVLESLETANLTLSGPTAGVTLGARVNATLNIADDEVNSPGALAFTYANFSTQENWGYVRVYVDRTDGLIGAVSVAYSTGGGTAVADVHYRTVSGTLQFAAGQKQAYFDVPLINNKTYGGTKTLEVRLANPGGGARLGNVATAVVSILDDEKP